MKTCFIFALALGAQLVASSRKCACCSTLANAKGLEGKVLFPDNAAYSARLKTYYSANAALEPWCMVIPTSTDDVSKIARIISDKQCPFGMRSGAHSAFKASNGVENGITIDFGYMNTTTYNKQTNVASIQPGATWGDVYTELQTYGVTSVGGRASVVGVAGFTTGSGYSFYSGVRGHACDNVVNFEIVLANGTIVNANAEENADLWKAQKGGSGNLGFVTRIDQDAVLSTQMWGGIATYDPSNSDAVFDAFQKFADNWDNDPASQAILANNFSPDGFYVAAILTNIEADAASPSFNGFFAITNTSSTLRVGSHAELVPEFTGPTPLGLYANWATGTFKNDIRVMKFIHLKHQEYVNKMKVAAPTADFNIFVQLQPVSKGFVQHGVERGGNVLGLEKVVADGAVIEYNIPLTVDTAANQEILFPLAVALRREIDDYIALLGVGKDWIFLNYAYGDQKPFETYGANNIALLKSVSAKYDPNGVFQHLRQSGFKLPA